MIPVKEAPEPKSFDSKVRRPGMIAIAELVGKTPPYPRTGGKPFAKIASRERDIPSKKFPTYWTKALKDMMRAYGEICAYSCFRIHSVTGGRSADHFAPKSRKWKLAYEWSNYRLCCTRMNGRKRDFTNVLDPFKIKPGWFQLDDVGFKIIPNKRLSKATRDKIQATIDQLGLNRFRRAREKDAERYWKGDISLRTLKEDSPFVAMELRRLGRLNPGDRW